MERIIIREITKEDKQGLVKLYDKVWPETAGSKYGKTSWAVDTSEYKGMLAEKEGVIIGSRMAFHTNMHCGSDRLTCVQFGDSCVDSDFRRCGLFSRMNVAFLESFFKDKNALIYNVSVDASKKAYKKVGWVYIDALMGLFYSPNPLKLLWKIHGNIKKLSGNPTFDRSPIPDVDLIPEELLTLREEQFVIHTTIHDKYDRETIRWRVQTDSGIKLHTDNNGACLYKTGIKDDVKYLVIGEIFLVQYNQSTFNKCLKRIIAMTTPDIVKTSITYAHPLFIFYRRFGFIINPFKRYLNLGIRVNSEIMRVVCYNPDNWALSNIDIDTF